MTHTAHRPSTAVSRVPPPSRIARIAAYASAAAAVIGFIPLHLVWAFKVPLFANEAMFEDWYADGGGLYLFALCILAALPAVMSLALVRPWGLVFPRWVPMVAGRRVPRRLLVIPGYTVPALLLLYSLYAVVVTIVEFDSPEAIFSPWTAVYGLIQFIPWWLGLFLATRSYAARTAPSRP
ncbi:hypothetical protein ACLQ28_14465 [Micromonospora sp. DT201]|uniref:hypothetical protein n=1 Tax=Micromonospora sp. DT201 TaxID=3393442 RepID=UPI003CEC79BA